MRDERNDRRRDPADAPVETEGMGGAGGGDIDDVGDVGYPRRARGTTDGEPGIVTGITTGSATDDATEGPGSPWENIDDVLREARTRRTDSSST